MKKIFFTMVFVVLLVASNCFAVTFTWIEVISDTRMSEWRFTTDLLVVPGYSPSYEVSFSVEGGPAQEMNYLYFGTNHVYDSGVIGTPPQYEGKVFSWDVVDGSVSIHATTTIPIALARQVALSTNVEISGDPMYPTVSWTNPEGSNPALINGYRLRVQPASDLTKLLWEINIPNLPPGSSSATYTFVPSGPLAFGFQPGVEYLIRIEARQYFYYPVYGTGLGTMMVKLPNGQPLAALLNRSTVFATYVYPILVEIDIKPGSDPNSINLKSKGVLPVAVLTSQAFDASMIDPDSVSFAGASPERWTMCDVDDDGDQDMLFHFRTQELNLNEESTEATLTGYSDGKLFEGTDSVRIVPAPKKK